MDGSRADGGSAEGEKKEQGHSRGETEEKPPLNNQESGVASGGGGSEDPWQEHPDPWVSGFGQSHGRHSWEESQAQNQWQWGDWSSSSWARNQWGSSDWWYSSWPSSSWWSSSYGYSPGRWVGEEPPNGALGHGARDGHGLLAGHADGDGPRVRGCDRPGPADVSWYNEAQLEASLEFNPDAWPQGLGSMPPFRCWG